MKEIELKIYWDTYLYPEEIRGLMLAPDIQNKLNNDSLFANANINESFKRNTLDLDKQIIRFNKTTEGWFATIIVGDTYNLKCCVIRPTIEKIDDNKYRITRFNLVPKHILASKLDVTLYAGVKYKPRYGFESKVI